MSYVDDISDSGFAIREGVVEAKVIESLKGELDRVEVEGLVSQRAGKAFGLRNLMNVVPFTCTFANYSRLMLLVEPILGRGARVVRGIYFDKHKDANWKVTWHQDLTIAVRGRVEVDDFRA